MVALIIAILLIVASVWRLLTFPPIGSLGKADGQSYEVDRFAILGYLALVFLVGMVCATTRKR